jgi:hypothetical protein
MEDVKPPERISLTVISMTPMSRGRYRVKLKETFPIENFIHDGFHWGIEKRLGRGRYIMRKLPGQGGEPDEELVRMERKVKDGK